jgi:hypothetical protein
MIIAGKYSFNEGEKVVLTKYPHLYKEIKGIISNVKAEQYQNKRSEEKTMVGRMLFSPPSLNKAFKAHFQELNWQSKRQLCEYPTEYYTLEYMKRKPTEIIRKKKAFREMDFVKEQLGVEVQFGKYSFMVYNVCAKNDHI